MIIKAKESQPLPSGEFTVHRSTIKLKRRELVFMGGSLTCWELWGTNDDGDYGGDVGDHNYDCNANAKRAGGKGLRAESARAVTGRRCPHSGKGEDFLSRQPNFLRKQL